MLIDHYNLQRGMSENKGRVIKLLCPSFSKSKVTQLVVWDEQKIDLGSIARAFGLDPITLRLNGHFISRGVDLISSSVTWNSLLSFFSAKGFSTHPLLVTGKLCKLGNKRGHDSQDFQNDLGKNKKLRESNSAEILNRLSCKRKQQFEDAKMFKKLKIKEDKSDTRDKKDDLSGSISFSQFTCSYGSKNLKRIREDEAIVAANYKRIR